MGPFTPKQYKEWQPAPILKICCIGLLYSVSHLTPGKWQSPKQGTVHAQNFSEPPLTQHALSLLAGPRVEDGVRDPRA